MEIKKNPKIDLNRKSGLFFVIGLVVVLLFVWRALEYKSYPKEKTYIQTIAVADYLEEEAPVTEALNTPPPPAPPAAPAIIEIIEDIAEIEETVIKSTEVSQETVVETTPLKVDEIVLVEEEEEVPEVPFAVIEDVPVFPGCKGSTNEEQKDCFQKKIQAHVQKNFSYPEVAVEMGIQGKVYVQFIIDNKGNISNIRTRGPNKLLEKEADRIISLLPKMSPGLQRGRPVKVPYTIPITFRLQ